jgi:H+/Cl- antiporter ClcA
MSEPDTTAKNPDISVQRNAKGQFVPSPKSALNTSSRRSMKNMSRHLTADEIKVRVWAFVVLAVVGVFVGITSMMLYSLTFVEQPMKAMAPIDQAYTKMLNDIVLLIVGAIGGIASEKGLGVVSNAINKNHDAEPKS